MSYLGSVRYYQPGPFRLLYCAKRKPGTITSPQPGGMGTPSESFERFCAVSDWLIRVSSFSTRSFNLLMLGSKACLSTCRPRGNRLR
jgi:hypothetical protein